MGRVLVIGGSNTDVVGVPDGGFVPRDSNPGHVTLTAGGVGRNVAENLARLGLQVSLVTAFGDDANGRARREECAALGIDVSRALVTPEIPGPVYLAVLDENGDLAAAVSDMRALEAVGPARLAAALDDIGALDAVVVDANLRAETLGRALEQVPDVPLFIECVSAAKVGRVNGLLGRAHGIHANVLEAGELCGIRFERSRDGALRAARGLVDAGVRAAYVTAGGHGGAWATGDGEGTFRAPAAEVRNATGAGDAFMAGLVMATVNGHGPETVVQFAGACAAITLRSERTVAPELDFDAVLAEMEAMQ